MVSSFTVWGFAKWAGSHPCPLLLEVCRKKRDHAHPGWGSPRDLQLLG